MVQKLDLIKGGGGSIKVGTTGTIGSLMTKELDSAKCTPPTPISTRQKPSTVSVSLSCGAVSSPKKIKPRRSLEDPSSSGNSGSSERNNNYKLPESIQKARNTIVKKTNHASMLSSEDAAVEITTPSREKADMKINIVEVVDIKCGNPNKWSSPIANRFKKLSFSRLSETIN